MLYFSLISYALILTWAVVLGLETPSIAASARIYPQVLIALVAILSLVIVAQQILARSRPEPVDARIGHLLETRGAARHRMIGFVAVWVAYAFGLAQLGFIVSTSLAIALSLALLGIRHILFSIACALVFSLVMAVLLQTVLYIPTPSGPVDQLLTRTIYALRH